MSFFLSSFFVWEREPEKKWNVFFTFSLHQCTFMCWICLCLMITFWPCCHRKTLHLPDDRVFFFIIRKKNENEELELLCCSPSLSLRKNETSFNVTHFSLLHRHATPTLTWWFLFFLCNILWILIFLSQDTFNSTSMRFTQHCPS